MKLNKVGSIVLLLQEASRIACDLQFGKNHQRDQAEIDLLSILFKVQSQVISMKAKRYLKQFVAENSQSGIKSPRDEGGADIIRLDRRQDKGDRRKLRTYIADDRRSGFADRRRKKLFEFLKQKAG